jgi:hypothetical protein
LNPHERDYKSRPFTKSIRHPTINSPHGSRTHYFCIFKYSVFPHRPPGLCVLLRIKRNPSVGPYKTDQKLSGGIEPPPYHHIYLHVCEHARYSWHQTDSLTLIIQLNESIRDRVVYFNERFHTPRQTQVTRLG